MEKKDEALRYNEGKDAWALVDFIAMRPLVQVLMFGAKKYAPGNWTKGMNRMNILESLQRHMVALFAGEQNDPESGLPHIGHIMCNCMFYSYYSLYPKLETEYKLEGKKKLDEYTKEKLDEMIEKGREEIRDKNSKLINYGITEEVHPQPNE